MMDIDNFLWFIEEREKIRTKKELGISPPYTDDFLLSKTHFLNIHFEHDSGTIRLHKFINNMSDWEKLFYIFTYRTVYSSERLLKDMTKIWFHDFRNLMLFKWKTYSDPQPYHIHIGRHSSIDQFLINTVLPVQKRFWRSFSKMKEGTIQDMENVLTFLFNMQIGRQYRMLSSIIVQDLAIQFPDKVDPDSECNKSIIVRQMLKRIPGARSKRKMDELCQITGLKHSSLNRAICEWQKYQTRKKYYEGRGSLRKEWLVHAL